MSPPAPEPLPLGPVAWWLEQRAESSYLLLQTRNRKRTGNSMSLQNLTSSDQQPGPTASQKSIHCQLEHQCLKHESERIAETQAQHWSLDIHKEYQVHQSATSQPVGKSPLVGLRDVLSSEVKRWGYFKHNHKFSRHPWLFFLIHSNNLLMTLKFK